MKPIAKEDFSKWKKSYQITSKLEANIRKRIGYVLDVLMKTFGTKMIDWYFSDDDYPDLFDNVSRRYINSIIVETESDPNDGYQLTIIDKNGKEWNWNDSIPLRWLYEDCEKEIIDGKALYDAKLQNKLDQKLSQFTKTHVIADRAKAKLTPEELEALKKIL